MSYSEIKSQLHGLPKSKPKRPHTWGSIYRNSLARGDDHGYAAMLADQWEARQKKGRRMAHCRTNKRRD